MAKRYGDHSSLGDVLKDVIGSGKLKKGLDKVTAAQAWHSVMGEAITKYTTDVKLDGSTLYVSLSSSVLREELSYGRAKIIAMINEATSEELVKKLVLR